MASSDPINERIVELCSAANAVEAHEICLLLEEAGIQARVVGEELGSAAGGLPLGEPTAPRLWVREADLRRAREVLREATVQPPPESGEPLEPLERDAADRRPPAARFRWLSRFLAVIAAAFIVVGSIWAFWSWMILREHPGVTEGVLVEYVPKYDAPMPSRDLPVRAERFGSYRFDLEYAYVVDGKTYRAFWETRGILNRVKIHYDPAHPEKNVVGSVTSPRIVLAVAWGVGFPLAVVAYWLRKRGEEVGADKA